MSELQKINIENLLKARKKTKRDLSKLLGIKENSINRILRNSNISLAKLGIIADFLEVEITDLLPKNSLVRDVEEKYQTLNPEDAVNQLTVNNLAEALKRNSKTIENLVRIIAEHFPEKNHSGVVI
jgi:transcriptional regulator with XRE-family HTH domain